MPVLFQCDECGAPLKVTRKKIGREVDCPKCGHKVVVPQKDTISAEKLAELKARKKSAAGGSADEEEGSVSPEAEEAKQTAAAVREPPPPGETPPSEPAEDEEYEEDDEDLIDEFIVYEELPAEESPPAEPQAAESKPAADETTKDKGQQDKDAVAQDKEPKDEAKSDEAPASAPAPTAAAPDLAGKIVLSRKVIFLQFLLLLVIASGAFGIGYLMGRGDAQNIPIPVGKAKPDSMVLEGRIVYSPREGETVADDGAVVVAMPLYHTPTEKIGQFGLRPGDEKDDEYKQQILFVEAAGGSYVRTDADGNFMLTVRQIGKYYLLYISAHTQRRSGDAIKGPDLRRIQQHFRRPEILIGQRKYHIQEITADQYKHLGTFRFGASRKPIPEQTELSQR